MVVAPEVARIIAAALPGDQRAYYAALQTCDEPAALVEILIPEVERLLADEEAELERLTAYASEQKQRVLRLDRLVAAARAIRHDIAPEEAVGLRGRAIGDIAVTVAGERGRREMHYREWYELVRQSGYLIASRDPEAAFLTALTRDARLERVGSRTGIYRLREETERGRGGS